MGPGKYVLLYSENHIIQLKWERTKWTVGWCGHTAAVQQKGQMWRRCVCPALEKSQFSIFNRSPRNQNHPSAAQVVVVYESGESCRCPCTGDRFIKQGEKLPSTKRTNGHTRGGGFILFHPHFPMKRCLESEWVSVSKLFSVFRISIEKNGKMENGKAFERGTIGLIVMDGHNTRVSIGGISAFLRAFFGG